MSTGVTLGLPVGASVPLRHQRALATNLRRLRKEHRLTQEEVAKSIGRDQTLIHRLEFGSARPSEETLLRLAYLYDVTVDSLYKPLDEAAATLGGGEGGGDGRG